MAITLITGPANAGKAELAIEAVRRHLARGEEPLLIVPTSADVEHYRRELAGEGALMGGRVLGFDHLVDTIVQRAGPSEPVLGPVARGRVVAAVAQETLHREPSRALLRLAAAAQELIVELRVRRVSPARLDGALARWEEAGMPGVALGDLFRSYDRELREMGRDPGRRLRV